jgi:penicillin amidase
VEDCVRLQCDTVNIAARRVLAALDGLPAAGTAGDEDGARVSGAATLLHGWDHDETVDSAAAALYQVWLRRHLRPALLRHAVTPLVTSNSTGTDSTDTDVTAEDPNGADSAVASAVRRLLPDETLSADVRADLAMLERLRADPVALHRVLSSSLRSAWIELTELLGADPTRWRWGALHHAAPAHPLADLLSTEHARLPRVERAGSGDTVMAASYDATFRQHAGASFRIVVDVGGWDNSRAMNSPGQSGRPGDPHWADLYPLWARDASFPLYYSRAAVEAHTRTRYLLRPDP